MSQFNISGGGLNISGGGLYIGPLAASGGSISFVRGAQNAIIQYAGQSQFAFGTGDYTIELWMKVISGDGIFFALSAGYTNGLQFYNNNTGALLIATAASGVQDIGGTAYGTWVYYTFVRHSGTTTVYVNGSSSYSFSDPSTYTTASGYPLFSDPGYGYNSLNVLMKGIRIVKGTAVYTSNFTPPTVPLTAIPNTSLLLNAINPAAYLADSSPNNFTPLAISGAVTWSSDSPYP